LIQELEQPVAKGHMPGPKKTLAALGIKVLSAMELLLVDRTSSNGATRAYDS
jgi:hypothetical protein